MAARLTSLIVVSIVAATFIAGIITRAQREDPGPVDLIVVNGKVHAKDGSVAEALAVRGNTIVVVGTNREVNRLRRPQTTVLDAEGGSVLPGFNDAHTHFVAGSLELAELELTGATTVDDVTARLVAYASAHPTRNWIVGHGWSPAIAGLTNIQLDAALPSRPILLLSDDGSAALASSEALRQAGVTRAKKIKGGLVVRDRRGMPTGVLKGAAVLTVRSRVPAVDRAETLASMRNAIDYAHAHGVTSIQSAGAAEDVALWSELREERALTVRVFHAFEVSPATPVSAREQFEALRRQYGDDALFKTGAVEVSAPDEDGLKPLVTTFADRGWQLWVRSSRNLSPSAALDTLRASGHDARGHRIVHVHPSDEETDEAATLGVAMLAGSGWPDGPLDPLTRIRADLMPLPMGEFGPPPAPVDALALKTVIERETERPAYASFDGQRKGTLAPGQLADLVVLSNDLGAVIPDELEQVKVTATIFNGEIVHRAVEAD